MLLAAGLGTRLRPLTDERPKPAVPLGLEPLSASAMRTFRAASVTRLDVNAFHLPDVLERELAPYVPEGVPAFFHREATLLGTGGGLRASLAERSDEPVLVMNGDIRFAPDVAALAAVHAHRRPLATLVVRPHPDPFALGAVEVDRDGMVVRIAGKPEATRAVHAAYVFTGVYVLAPEAYAWLPEEGCVVRKSFQPMLAKGEAIATVVDAGDWADLGTIEAYFEASVDLAARAREPHGILDRHASVHDRAVLERCVVGAGALVGPNARLRDCVVWPGASVDAALERAIVTPKAVVSVPAGA